MIFKKKTVDVGFSHLAKHVKTFLRKHLRSHRRDYWIEQYILFKLK